MESVYSFGLAASEDDDELRALLSATPMGGDISIAFRREPGFFRSSRMDGIYSDIIVVRCRGEGIVGMGIRSVRELYVNGQSRRFGYLSTLRCLPKHRGGTLLPRAYKYLKSLHHSRGDVPAYITTIASGNRAALSALTGARAGLPYYHDRGNYHTLAIPVSRRTRFRKEQPGYSLCAATARMLPAIVSFLNEHGAQRQFFPVVREEDFFIPGSKFDGLAPENLFVACQGDRICGLLGAWDQSAFRQQVVHGYHNHLQYTRPLYNAWAMLRGYPKLPPPGAQIRAIMGALFVTANRDPMLLELLAGAALESAAQKGFEFLLIGFHENDGFTGHLRPWSWVEYRTRLFLVSWLEFDAFLEAIDDRSPYLELGTL